MGKLEQLAAQRGQSVGDMVELALTKHKSVYRAASVEFDVTPNTLFMWLRRNGYKVTISREWKKKAETA